MSNEPEKIYLEASKQYKICTCGASKQLPFCDNSHRQITEAEGTRFHSLKITPESDIEILVSSKNWDGKK